MSALLLAIDQATRERDQLARQLAATQHSLHHGQQQMQQLESYAQDTDARWINAPSNSPEVMHHHYQFVARLQQAIAMQRDTLLQLDLKVEAARHALLGGETRLAGLHQVHATRMAQERREQERKEQRTTDDMATSIYIRRLGTVFGD